MNKQFSVSIAINPAATYGFSSASTFPNIIEITSCTYSSSSSLPSTATLYATTSASVDELIDDNIIGTITFSGSTGAVTIVNSGKALIGKSYIGIVMNTSQRIVISFNLYCDLASTVKVFNGSSWDECPVRAYNGTEFVPAQVFRYDGTQWVECTALDTQDDT